MMMAATLLAGCSGGVVGEWQGVKPTLDQRNSLTVEEDGGGKATVFIYRTVQGMATADAFTFDVDWSERETMFDFDFVCATSPFGECDEEDSFDLNCEIDEDDDTRMSCKADGRWDDYAFDWRRLED